MQSFDSFSAIDWFCTHHLKSAIKAGLLSLVISPRLIPRICPSCAVPFEASRVSTTLPGAPSGVPLKMNQGCDTCKNRDYETAELFFEHFRIDSELIGWIDSGHSAIALRRQARESGRKALYDTVMQDTFAEQLDLLSVMKLHAVLS